MPLDLLPHIHVNDTQLYAECPPLNHADALRKIDECVCDIRRWLNCNHLLLNRTEAIVFHSTTICSPSAMSTINVCGSAVSLTPTVRDIGVIFDSGLDMSAQVSNTCRVALFNLFRIAKILTSLTITACKTLVHSLVTSRINYGNAVLYGISDCLLHRLEMVQRSAARDILQIRRGDRQSMTAVLMQLHWLLVTYSIAYKLLIIVFRALHDRMPSYLASLIRPYVPHDLPIAPCLLFRATTSSITAAIHALVLGRLYGTRYRKTCVWPGAWTHLKRILRLIISNLLLMFSSIYHSYHGIYY